MNPQRRFTASVWAGKVESVDIVAAPKQAQHCRVMLIRVDRGSTSFAPVHPWQKITAAETFFKATPSSIWNRQTVCWNSSGGPGPPASLACTFLLGVAALASGLTGSPGALTASASFPLLTWIGWNRVDQRAHFLGGLAATDRLHGDPLGLETQGCGTGGLRQLLRRRLRFPPPVRHSPFQGRVPTPASKVYDGALSRKPRPKLSPGWAISPMRSNGSAKLGYCFKTLRAFTPQVVFSFWQ